MQLSQYFLPIIPNPNEYLYSIIFFLYPLVMMRLVKNYLKISKTENTSLDYSKGKYYFLGYGFAIIILTILVYFVSGYFRYYTIAIASGSMENTIFKGDVVIIDKEYQTIDKNDILVMNDKLLKEKTLYFGNLDEKSGRNITSLDDEDLIIVRKNKDYYQKRLYG